MIGKITSVALAAAVVVSAQQQPNPQPLTLADAQRIALQNHPQFASAKFTAAAARQVPTEIQSNLKPMVSGLLTGVGADPGSRLAAGGLNNPVVYNRLGSGLALSQLLTDFGRTNSLATSAKLRADAQDQATESTRAVILINVVRAYSTVLRANEVLKVARKTVEARQLVSDQVTELFKNQLKSQLDVSFANVNLADAQLLLSQSQSDVKAAEAELANAMGVPSLAPYTLTGEAMPGALREPIDDFIAQALAARPELKQLRLEQAAAERFVKAEHALYYPSIALAGSAGFASVADTQVPGRYGAIGINVTIPLFNGGLFRARQSEADLRAKATAENVKDLANRVTRDVRIAYLNAQTAWERVDLTEQLVKQARLALDLAQGRYDLGLSSIVELSQAQLNLTVAEIRRASASYDYMAERALLDFQAGSLR